MGWAYFNLRPALAAIVAVCFVASGAALADIGESLPAQSLESRPVQRQSCPPGRLRPGPASDFGYNSPARAEFTDVVPVAALAGAWGSRPSADAPRQPQAIRQLPAGPGGASLFLVAVGCVGVVKLGKSARGLHLHSLPDWYHAGGPTRIGHAIALDLQSQTPILCQFDQPGDTPALVRLLRRDIQLRRKAQFTLLPTVPRGPPALRS